MGYNRFFFSMTALNITNHKRSWKFSICWGKFLWLSFPIIIDELYKLQFTLCIFSQNENQFAIVIIVLSCEILDVNRCFYSLARHYERIIFIGKT